MCLQRHLLFCICYFYECIDCIDVCATTIQINCFEKFVSPPNPRSYGFVCMTYSLNLLPSWELTYPLPRRSWRWFSFSPRGICFFSLEGIMVIDSWCTCDFQAQDKPFCVCVLIFFCMFEPPACRSWLRTSRGAPETMDLGFRLLGEGLWTERWSFALTNLTWLCGKSTMKVEMTVVWIK